MFRFNKSLLCKNCKCKEVTACITSLRKNTLKYLFSEFYINVFTSFSEGSFLVRSFSPDVQLELMYQ